MDVKLPPTPAPPVLVQPVNGTVNTAVIIAVVAIIIATLGGVVYLAQTPESNNTIVLILTFMAPIIVGLLALAVSTRAVSGQVQQIHLAINSRLSELLATTGAAAHAQGVNDANAANATAATTAAATAAATTALTGTLSPEVSAAIREAVARALIAQLSGAAPASDE